MTRSLSTSFAALLWVPVLVLAGLLTGCDNAVVDPNTDDGGQQNIEVPSAYSFDSRFEENSSSVAYPGQIVRNLLIRDLKAFTDGLAKEGASSTTKEELLRFYQYEDSYDKKTLTSAGDLSLKEDHYSAIATGKDLHGKVTSEYANEALIGREETADQLIRAYLDSIATRSQNPDYLGTPAAYTTANGVDMSQMVNKLLLGAVVYSQGTGKYLNVALDANNTDPRKGTDPFTEMEHVWDEAFGYFGAARDYSISYTDEQLASGSTYKDSNEDGQIDLESEYSFTYATYAGKRDKGGSGVDFTKEIFEGFLEGRTAIVNQASTSKIAAARDKVGKAWEKLVAANVVHYINSTLGDLGEVTESQAQEKNNEELNEHWAEMKGFAYALQYNNLGVRQISDDQLKTLHELIGNAPVYAAAGTEESEDFKSDLNEAKQLLQQVFGFSSGNLANW